MVTLEIMKVTAVAFMSVILGGLMMAFSGMLINIRDTLSHHDPTLFLMWMFTLLTFWAGLLQFFSGACLLFRRIVMRRWITVNAVAFIIMMIAVCVLSSTILRDHRGDAHVVVSDVKPQREQSGVPAVDFANETETETLEIVNFAEEGEAEATTINDLNNNIESEGVMAEKKVLILMNPNSFVFNGYCATIMTNFILLPIFLGQMATRVKFEFKNKHLDDRLVYPLMS